MVRSGAAMLRKKAGLEAPLGFRPALLTISSLTS